MAKVKEWVWSGCKEGGLAGIHWWGSAKGGGAFSVQTCCYWVSYSTASNTSFHLGAVQCSFMRLAIFFLFGPQSKCCSFNTYHKEACVPHASGRNMSCAALHCHSKHPPWRERGSLHCYSQWLSLRETPIKESLYHAKAVLHQPAQAGDTWLLWHLYGKPWLRPKA